MFGKGLDAGKLKLGVVTGKTPKFPNGGVGVNGGVWFIEFNAVVLTGIG